MTSPIKKSGTPLSAIFDPWVSGTDKAPATGIEEDGVDICNKYAPLKYGSKAALTGVKSKNVDLRDIFAAKGTAVYAGVVANPGWPSFVLQQLVLTQQTATGSLAIKPDGTWSSTRGVSGSPTSNESGNWYSAPASGVGNPYQVRMTFTATRNDGATITNGASNYVALNAQRSFVASLPSPSSSGTTELSGTLRIQIRRSSDSVVLSDQSIPVSFLLEQN